MIATLLDQEQRVSIMKTYHQNLTINTEGCFHFVDITNQVLALIRTSNIRDGMINIHTKHTTTGIIVNEHEPLLLQDIKCALERLAPQAIDYQHNNFKIRTVNMTSYERPNGHSHCKAVFLRTSETLNIVDGELQLGTWQRIFFVELDCSLTRNISLMIMGLEY
jgi:secondary thiamine-phosphate synthase enzyme